MRRLAIAVAALTLLVAAAPAAAATVSGWDGKNPFKCELQHAGLGPTGPHPEADPYCIDFDKTHQNVTQLGVVQFLSEEPARVAAASPKCFYFQSDHWRGSIVQDDGTTKTYEWDGHYFFDKARGDGGVWVTNFNVNGHTGDPSELPGMPSSFSPYYGPGTGGTVEHGNVPVDPSCAARAAAHASDIYATPAGHRQSPHRRAGVSCRRPGARAVGPGRLGPLRLRYRERRVRALMGIPFDVRRGYLRYCLRGGGQYLVGVASSGTGALGRGDNRPTLILIATGRAYRLRGVGPGATTRALARAFPRAHRIGRADGMTIWSTGVRSDVVFATRHGHVRAIAIYNRRAVRGRHLIALVRRGL